VRRFVAIWIGLALVGCGGNEQGESSSNYENQEPPAQEVMGEPTKVVAEIGDETITLGELNRVVQAMRVNRPPDIDPNASTAVLQQKALNNLIDQRLLVLAAQDRGLSVTDADFNAAVTQIKARFPNEAAFAGALQQQGMTQEEFIKSFRSDLTIRNFVQSAFTDTINVSLAEAQTYYDTHPEEFMSPEAMRARHILMRSSPNSTPEEDAAARSRAEAAHARIQAGEDFAAVANEVSEDETTNREGGSLRVREDSEFFMRGEMVAAFDSVAFSLAPGAVSGPVKTQFGYHIIKVEEKRQPGLMEFDPISAQVIQKLQQDRVNDRVKEFLAAQREKVDIKREI
jgi:peptidyl-prolyl cis-trans isomerase C